ncbi:MAG TPA: DNA polymerase III subunit delta' [Stellaceae bacterium]|nr:DNA polymerase III subunit delta' [Stellaceae bacterium]
MAVDREAVTQTQSTAPAPRANPDLVGHEAAERELERLFRAGRLPHAILLAGPRGIGKATLAFRFARFVLAQGDDMLGQGDDMPTQGDPAAAAVGGDAAGQSGLAIAADSGVFRRVAAAGHADLLTVERAWDPRRRRLRGEIVIDDVREIIGFFRLTAAEEGWRVVVVDGAEEMNRSAANALLKIIEEPPDRGLLLLVSHNPGRVLPTIRSRCRQLRLMPPSQDLAARLVRHYRPRLDAAEAASLAALCGGSIGQALGLADSGGFALYRTLLEILSTVPELDVPRLHAFADRLVRSDADDAYRVTEELLLQLVARLATTRIATALGPESDIVAGERALLQNLGDRALGDRAERGRWAALHAKIADDFAAADGLNLDRRQTLLGVFFAIAEAAR